MRISKASISERKVGGGGVLVSPSYRSLDGGVGQVIWEGTEKTNKKKLNRWRGKGSFLRGGAERGGGKSGEGSQWGPGAVLQCLLGREKSSSKLCGILLYVLGVADLKIKMLWTLRRAFISGGCPSLWHYWAHEMLP